MTKETKEIQPETLDSQVKIGEKFETVYPETIEIPNYDYGNSQNTLDYNIALRNKPTGGGNFKIGYFTFNTTGNKVITGVGFKPKLVQFFYTNQSDAIGMGSMDGTSQFGYEEGLGSQIQTECIYFRNGAGTAQGRAVYVSMDDDGFTINATLASVTIFVNRIAFG